MQHLTQTDKTKQKHIICKCFTQSCLCTNMLGWLHSAKTVCRQTFPLAHICFQLSGKKKAVMKEGNYIIFLSAPSETLDRWLKRSL